MMNPARSCSLGSTTFSCSQFILQGFYTLKPSGRLNWSVTVKHHQQPKRATMKTTLVLFSLLLGCARLLAADKTIPNRMIDYPTYLRIAQEVQNSREKRRLTEEQFLSL